jgi:hypothetical protein
MDDPVGGAVGDPGAPTTYVGDINGYSPLGGTIGDPGMPIIYVGNVDGGLPGRR